MLYYFYLTRNIIGLILILSPLAGFLYIDSNFILSMIPVCTVSALVPLKLQRRFYSAEKALLMAALWTGTLISGAGFSVLMERSTYAAFTAAVISVFAGLFCRNRHSAAKPDRTHRCHLPEHQGAAGRSDGVREAAVGGAEPNGK